MRIWADVENASGEVQGSGPLNNLINARITRQLDGAGDFAMDVPLADARVQELVDTEARVTIWGYAPGTVINQTPGEISYTGASFSASSESGASVASRAFDNDPDTWWTSVNANGWLQVELSASIQLVSYSIQAFSNTTAPRTFSLQVQDGVNWVDVDTQADQTGWTTGETRTFTLNSAAIGQVWRLNVTINNGAALLYVRELNLIADDHLSSAGNKLELGSGIIENNQYTDVGSGTRAQLSGPDILDELKRKNTLLNRGFNNEPIADVLDELIALVSGWSIDYTGVSGDIYARYDGASVLAALQDLAGKQGYHFRLDGSRNIKFGALADDSGKRIIQGGRNTPELEANDDVLPITRLEKVETSRDLVNWIMPVGRGEGERSINLAYSTRPYKSIEGQTTGVGGILSLQWSPEAGGPYTSIAQSFQIDAEKSIKAVRLHGRKWNTPTGTLTIEIETDNAGEPSGTLVHANATTTFAEEDLTTTEAWFTAVFASAFTLSASTTYWVVITTDRAAHASNIISLNITAGDYYADGLLKKLQGGTWSVYYTTDLIFDIQGAAVGDYVIQSMTGPDGATLYYLSDSASITTYGQIEKAVSFNIAALTGENPDLIAASNALYDAAVQWLLEHKDKQTVYRCSVANVRANLLPGQSVPLTYKGYVWDETGTKVSWADITNETFYILKVTEEFGASHNVNLEISDTLLPITTPASQVASIIQAAQTQSVRIYNRMDDLPSTCGGRLTLTSGTPVTTADVTAATTVFFAPYIHNQITLYNGARWVPFVFEEMGYDLSSLTANTVYDVFMYDNAGLLTLDVTAWSNSGAGTSARATALVRQNGVWVKTGATGYRYLGTVMITGTTGQCEDSEDRRFVWNLHNQVWRRLHCEETTVHANNTGSTRAWNNSTTVGETRMLFVVGQAEHYLPMGVTANLEAGLGAVGVGLNTTSALTTAGVLNENAERVRAGIWEPVLPSLGYNYAQVVETSNATVSYRAQEANVNVLG